METVKLKIGDVKEQFNPRSDFSKVEEIAESIKRVGLLQPIVVKQSGHDGQMVVVDGAQRLRAMKKLDFKEVEALVIEEGFADEAQMAANLMRSDLNVLERARGYERLIKMQPAKYNEAAIANLYGQKPAAIKKLIVLAKKLDPSIDAAISPKLQHFDLEDLEILAQVPVTKQLDVVNAQKGQESIMAVLHRIAFDLDFSGDALNTGAHVSTGRAFVLKSNEYREGVFTFDKALFSEAKKKYEAERPKSNYGGQQSADRELTEAQREREKKQNKQKRANRQAAVKAMPERIQAFLAAKPSEEDIKKFGRAICDTHVYSESARQLLSAYGVKTESPTREEVWKKVFQPLVKTPDTLVRLYILLSSANKYSQTSFAEQLSKIAAAK